MSQVFEEFEEFLKEVYDSDEKKGFKNVVVWCNKDVFCLASNNLIVLFDKIRDRGNCISLSLDGLNVGILTFEEDE